MRRRCRARGVATAWTDQYCCNNHQRPGADGEVKIMMHWAPAAPAPELTKCKLFSH